MAALSQRLVSCLRCLYSPRACAIWTILIAKVAISLLIFLAVRIPTSIFLCSDLQLGIFFFLFVLAVSLFFVTVSQLKSLTSNKWAWEVQIDALPAFVPAKRPSGLEMSKRPSAINEATFIDGVDSSIDDETALLDKKALAYAPSVPPAAAVAAAAIGISTRFEKEAFAASRTASCFRVLLCSLCVLSVGVLIGVSALLAHLRGKTLPDFESTLHIPGLSAPVNLYREAVTGILHIQAATDNDLFIAQGFSQAQTRMWQMEFQRRVGAGRLSEIVGDGGLDIDKTMRTLGVYKAAQRAVNEVSPSSLNILTQFSKGVNAYIAMMRAGKAATPLEMMVIPGAGYAIEDWSPADSLVWSKVMAYSLAGNLNKQLLRFELFVKQNLTMERIFELHPVFDGTRFPTILTNEDLQPPSFPGNFSLVKEWSAMYGTQTSVDSFLGAKGSVNGPIMAALVNARTLCEKIELRAKQGLLREEAPLPPSSSSQDDTINEDFRRRRSLQAVDEEQEGRDLEAAEMPPASRTLAQTVLSYFTPSKPSRSTLNRSILPRRHGTNPGAGRRASNSWVVGGKYTQSGFPLLNNDPHLQLMAPSIWMLTHLSSPNISVNGASFPGIPGVVLGRAFTRAADGSNTTVAWAVTNTAASVQQAFIMSDKPSDDTLYLYNGAYVPYNVTVETIKVAGDDDVSLRLRQCVYGTVVTDNGVFDGYGSSLALRWVSTDPTIPDTTMDAFFCLMTMDSYADFRNCLRPYIGPSQNFIYADSKGNFGYQTSGWIPLRAPNLGYTGALPVPGQGDPLFDWNGRIPFEVMPATYNPVKGFVATANNRVTPIPNSVNPGDGSSYNIFITPDWDEGSDGYRGERITNMITQQGPAYHNVSTMQGIQQDYFSGWARDLCAIVAALPSSFVKTTGGLGLKNRLAAFDGFMSIGSRTATLFEALYQELAKLAAEETGGNYWGDVVFIANALQSDATGTPDVACINKGFASCNAYLGSVLDGIAQDWAIVTATGTPKGGDTAPGSPLSDAQWGIGVHQATALHQILDGTPLQCLACRAVAHGGDDYTVNVGSVSFDGEEDKGLASEIRFPQIHGSSFRHISDLGAPEVNSRVVNFMGEDGAILAEGDIGFNGVTAFDSELQMWSLGGYSRMTMDLTLLGQVANDGGDDAGPVLQSLVPA